MAWVRELKYTTGYDKRKSLYAHMLKEILRRRDDVIATTCQFVDTCLSSLRIQDELQALESAATPETVVKRLLLIQDLDKCKRKRRVLRDVLANQCTAVLCFGEEVVTIE